MSEVDSNGDPLTLPDSAKKSSYVYFVLFGQYVKIGHAKCIRNRLTTIQISLPEKLVLLGVIHGGMNEERELHARFSNVWIRGEWFRFTEEIHDYIKSEAIPYCPDAESEVVHKGCRKLRGKPIAFDPMYPARLRRVRVWVQAMAGRPLALQWHDLVTGKRRTQSIGTTNPVEAEFRRADLEAKINAHGCVARLK